MEFFQCSNGNLESEKKIIDVFSIIPPSKKKKKTGPHAIQDNLELSV